MTACAGSAEKSCRSPDEARGYAIGDSIKLRAIGANRELTGRLRRIGRESPRLRRSLTTVRGHRGGRR